MTLRNFKTTRHYNFLNFMATITKLPNISFFFFFFFFLGWGGGGEWINKPK
jgi:hypothetical protein